MEIDFVDKLIGAMCAEIEKHGLEVMQRYPDDLLVHDRVVLGNFAVPGAQIAWMAGHCHTHLVRLGIHPEENQGVTYLTNLASEDRFYVISIASSGASFTLQEVTREQFPTLASTKVLYKRDGGRSGFWLWRDGQRVGSVMLDDVGTLGSPRYRATLTPVSGSTLLDRSALRLWAEKAIIEDAHTLFVRYSIEVAAAISLPRAA